MKYSILGKAIGKPTMTSSDRWKQRDCVMQYRAFCDLLRLKCYGKNVKQPLDGPTRLYVTCYIADTNKQFKRWGPHDQKPDASNILKAVEDALFLNDQKIYSSSCVKCWANGTPERIEVEWETDQPTQGRRR